MEMSLISINLIAKDEGKVVGQVISNILSQIDSKFEVVVVEGYSSDETYEILKSFESATFKILRSKGSRGKARNLALNKSSGRYILALDADQIYIDLMDATEEYLANYWEFGVTMGRSSFPILAPKGLLIEVGGWRDLHFMEDIDLWLRLSEKCRYLYLPGMEKFFGKHIREHKMRRPLHMRITNRIRMYRDARVAGIPVRFNGTFDRFLHFLGNPNMLFSRGDNIIDHYRELFYSIEVPSNLSNLDWVMRIHYKMITSECYRCKDSVFKEIKQRFEEVYGSPNSQLT
ncbi:glycosyl transferase [Metallosphaera yellowstonensis MK1]|jgi:glycosyltransferase involved in cell wall biosynthesis|uniref:Glycosyl transferase n=2 Tax=Metallosphaera TaxID=41980 RepID=H2C0J5_9CREN|nr:glycosyl transferase [Metallosphaera yellowstonensis MK1]